MELIPSVIIGLVSLVILTGIFSHDAGYNSAEAKWRKWLIDHDLARYHPQTGQWELIKKEQNEKI